MKLINLPLLTGTMHLLWSGLVLAYVNSIRYTAVDFNQPLELPARVRVTMHRSHDGNGGPLLALLTMRAKATT
jgi:hypothetical protein